MKYSRQREAVLEYLTHTKTHPTADEIYSVLKKEMPSISLATVYRNLTQLCENGNVRRLGAAGNKERFDGYLEPHYHFICSECGEVYDLDISFDMNLSEMAKQVSGFEVNAYSLVFYGICDNCKNLSQKTRKG